MPDENRFAGLSEAEKEEERTDAEPDAAADPAEPDDSEETGPAFEFDQTTAKSIYVREETLELLEDTEFEVEMVLRRNHSIRDPTGREFHDAAVRVLAEHTDEVVDSILAARAGEDEDAED
ncbi:hypothetical protein Halar_1221 [halophilic archaeon DL31]|jgi:hypothetical protein|nr:hypothetical protein Halar_1221 [halophilic archaeon DL31]